MGWRLENNGKHLENLLPRRVQIPTMSSESGIPPCRLCNDASTIVHRLAKATIFYQLYSKTATLPGGGRFFRVPYCFANKRQ